ncbi:hypothetical protein FRC12_000071 [Ceratobasidium sp. 428]|nr:hypothetical protein FRC12_000071 [Ceratobasidium sp. 428]
MSFGGSLIPPGNKISGSSSNGCVQGPHMLKFHGGKRWRIAYFWPYLRSSSPPRGSTVEWYQSQPTTKFTGVQHRKERSGPFFHEFIVIELDNDTVCRFDRRGDPRTRANAFTTEGITAEDTVHVIQKHETHYDEIHNTSDLLPQINLPDSKDLGIILRACYIIQLSEATRSYTLLEYNCYFFSWMILATVADFDNRGGHRMFGHRLSNFTLIKMKKEASTLGNHIMAKASAAVGAPLAGSSWRSQCLVVTIDSLVSVTEKLVDNWV